MFKHTQVQRTGGADEAGLRDGVHVLHIRQPSRPPTHDRGLRFLLLTLKGLNITWKVHNDVTLLPRRIGACERTTVGFCCRSVFTCG